MIAPVSAAPDCASAGRAAGLATNAAQNASKPAADAFDSRFDISLFNAYCEVRPS